MNGSGKHVAYHTLGCKLNFAETSTIARKMEDAGHETVPFEDLADLYVINTCTVTENADRDLRKLVNRIRRRAPEARIAAVGCYAQLKPEKIQSELDIDIVLGSQEKFSLATVFGKDTTGLVLAVDSDLSSDHHSFQTAFSLDERTRSFLKIQDGCDYPCTYCTIPMARGQSRCADPEEVLAEVREIVAQGILEIVLTGVNVGEYRWRNLRFYDLLNRIVDIPGLRRVRISSIEPNLLNREILELAAEQPILLPHFHVPLQSGSDHVLSAMKRRYRSELYAEKVALIREILPLAGIGADVIVGFPAETPEDFEKTYALLKDLEVTYLHVFTYSERENTPAARYAQQIPMEVRKERNRRLRILSNKKQHSFLEKNLGTIRPVLLESVKEGFLQGLTDNYLRVHLPQRADLQPNTIVDVKLSNAPEGRLLGEPVS